VQVSEFFPGLGHLQKSVQVLGLGHLPRQLVAFVSIFSVVGHVAHGDHHGEDLEHGLNQSDDLVP